MRALHRRRLLVGLVALATVLGTQLLGGPAALAKKRPAAPPAGLATSVLLFNSNRPGGNHNYEIWSMQKDGSSPAQLTSDATYDSWWPKPSPDRTRIMFVRSPAGTHDGDPRTNSIWMINYDGTGLAQVVPVGAFGWQEIGHPEWSPDGTRIVLYAGVYTTPEIYTLKVDGTTPVHVSNNGAGGDRGGPNTDPSWSADGTQILFNGCPLGMKICTPLNLEIFKMNADGTGEVQLTSNTNPDYDPEWSPDGNTIAWLEQDTNAEAWSMHAMNPDGSSQRVIIDDGGINSKPAWDADSSWIYFHRAVDPIPKYVFNVWKIRPDGSGLTEVITPRPADFSNNMSEYPVNTIH